MEGTEDWEKLVTIEESEKDTTKKKREPKLW